MARADSGNRPWLVFIGLFASLPFVAHYASHGMAALAAIVPTLFLLLPEVRLGLSAARLRDLAVAFGPLLLWGFCSALWSVDAPHSAVMAMRLTLLAVGVWVMLGAVQTVASVDRSRLALLGMASITLLFGLVVLDLSTDLAVMRWLKKIEVKPGSNDYLTYINQGIALLAVYVWPWAALIGVRFGKAAAIGAFLTVSVVLTLGNAVMPEIGVALGVAAFVLVRLFGGAAVKMVFGGLALGVALTPLLAHFLIDEKIEFWRSALHSWSLKHRIEIWHFAALKFKEQPWLGWGMDQSRNIPGGNISIPGFAGAEYMPLHPHNAMLHVWLELGAVGAAAFIFALVMVGKWIHGLKPKSTHQAIAIATFLTFCVQTTFSFGIWQNWWLASGGFAAVLCAIYFNAQEQAA
jgi:O-antigen ligase